jgi:hypothetical protein
MLRAGIGIAEGTRLSQTQTFVVDKQFALFTKASVWIFAAFVALSISLPFLPSSSVDTDCNQPSNPIALYVLSVIGAAFFGGLSWYARHVTKQFEFQSVAIDHDGLWYAHLTKDRGLVSWRDIAKIRERKFLQRLDLLDGQGTTLFKIEYQLSQYDKLRSIVEENTATQVELPALPSTFAKPILYHWIQVAGLVCFSLLGWYVGQFKPLLGYLGMAGLVLAIGYEYLTTISKITIAEDHLEISYPTLSRRISYPEITSIQLGDLINQGVRHPEVGLFIGGAKKPLRLRDLGIDAIALHQIIQELWKARQIAP